MKHIPVTKTISLDAWIHCTAYAKMEMQLARKEWARARTCQTLPPMERRALQNAYVTRYIAARRVLSELKPDKQIS